MNFYNEHDPKAAAWLRELIKQGHIPNGIVDERDIQDIRPDELREFTQCHFFAGIGGWSIALRLAGWSEKNQHGQEVAHANLSAREAKEKGLLMSATFGPPSNGSLRSVSLQWFLENRLRARMEGIGSPEFSLTWRRWAIAPQVQICALRALAHRTQGKGCIGLRVPTPTACDGKGSGRKREGRGQWNNLRDWFNIVLGWQYPPVSIHCWLMGYSQDRLSSAVTAMQSCRKSRPNLSKPSSKQNK